MIRTRSPLPEAVPGREDRTDPVRSILRRAWRRLSVEEAERPPLGGQLLRPRFGFAAAGTDGVGRLGSRLGLALLAVQLAHEASLLHDDVVDGAGTRRHRPTKARASGVGPALVEGDLLLARAYLASVLTGSLEFAERFARAVEATVEGERGQGAIAAGGERPDEVRMREIARAKSGELFGVALAAAATLDGSPLAGRLADLGRDVGLLYQRVDDLLDYCPRAATGKPPLADHSRGLWTWPRAHLDPDAPAADFFRDSARGIPALRALADLEAEGESLTRRIASELPGAQEVSGAVHRWLGSARVAVSVELAARAPSAAGAPRAAANEVFRRHARSFHFASRLMPRRVRGPVARAYAFCRAVDDAVDRAPDPDGAERALEALHVEARRGFEGRGDSANPYHLAMEELRDSGSPFRIVEELFEGVRMDLRPRRYEDLGQLRDYTHRVGGAPGLWIAALAGVRDPWALDRAAELGHAMQLTNIARDVGEDLRMGRIYLPRDLLHRHGLSIEALWEVAVGEAPVQLPLVSALEEILGWAEAGYRSALPAVAHLPAGYRRAVVVAARVYRGIHGEIRRNGYDTLTRRARTSGWRKLRLAGSALAELARMERLAATAGPRPTSPPGLEGPRATE